MFYSKVWQFTLHKLLHTATKSLGVMTPTAITNVADEVILKKPFEKIPKANDHGDDLDGEENDDGEDEIGEEGRTTGVCSTIISDQLPELITSRKVMQRRRKRRRNPRRRNWNNPIHRVSACPSFSPMVFMQREKYSLTRMSMCLFSLFYPTDELTHVLNSNSWRITSEEKRYEEKMAKEDPETTYNDIRRAAEVHRQVRQRARKFIRPGLTMTEIAEFIEDGTRALVEENGFESGIGFPTGLSLNNCAAHYTPNAGDTVGES